MGARSRTDSINQRPFPSTDLQECRGRSQELEGALNQAAARTAVLGNCASAPGDSDVARVSMSAWWARPQERPNPKGHCWRHPQRFMRAAEIVERDAQADCREMAIQFLAKAEPRSVRWLRPVVAFDHNDVDVHGARAQCLRL